MMGDAADDVFEAAERDYAERMARLSTRQMDKKMNTSEGYVSCEVEYKARSANAVLIAYQNEEHWIPRSLLSWACDKVIENLERGEVFTLKVKEWKATQLNLDWTL